MTNINLKTNTAVKPPQFKVSFLTSLRNRILLSMVAVAFLSAIFSGILYEVRARNLVNDDYEQYRVGVLNRIESSRLPDRTKEQIIDTLELRQPFAVGKAAVNFSLTQAVGAVIFGAFLASVLAFVAGWLLTKRFVSPLARLRSASQRVAQGDFSQHVPIEDYDEVGQVSYSFNLMATELQQAENQRRQLLSDVAHELKTPLASIQGHVEALRDNLPRAKANPNAIYDIVLEDVVALDRMVGSLRTWLNAQNERENLQIQPLVIKEELEAVVGRFLPRAEAAQVQLSVQVDHKVPPVLADRNALRHIVSNLVDNALRYTPAGGQVKLLAHPQDHQHITLLVADTGCGIAPEHWAHLFDRFYRVDKSRSRDTGGTGLGLALVKDLVDAQGGRVWLDSRIGKGTVFFVSLPTPSH